MATLMSKKQPTMQDVARLADVSQPTVSYVINDTASISTEVVKRVNNAIKQLGYVPNIHAKNLRSSKSKIIGLIVPDVGIRYYSQMVQAIERGLREKGLMVFLCNTFYDKDLEYDYIRTLVEHNVLGVISGTDLLNEKAQLLIEQKNVPMILLDASESECGLFNVKVDNYAMAKMAVKHLQDAGAKKISYLSESLSGSVLKSRYAYFKNACAQNGIVYDEGNSFIAKKAYNKRNKTRTGYDLAANILVNKDIDAVFCSSDEVAFGAIRRLKEHGVRIPEDVLIMGCDNDSFSSLISPKLTTIWQPLAQMVDIGIKAMLQTIIGEELVEKSVKLEPNIVIRESTMRMTSS